MRLKYPMILAFLIAITLAYAIFSNPIISNFISNLGELGYLGSFIAGIFYTFGFTSPFSVGFFIDLNPSNVWIAGILGGIGALVGDLLIFSFVRAYFTDEFKKIGKEKIVRHIGNIFKLFGEKLNSCLIYLLAAILIASPLPDEAGITILAGLTRIKAEAMAMISIIFNTIGILILLSL